MPYRVLAEFVVLIHFAFIVIAVLGGLLAARWRLWAWIHAPVVAWAVLIEWVGWVCPLTPLENWLRERAGGKIYDTGFIQHYILPVIYPGGLTRELQLLLGAFVLGVNLMIYGWLLLRARTTQRR